VAAFRSAHVPGSRLGLLSRPGRVRFGTRRRPWGSLWPFAVLIRPAVDRRLVDVGRTHLPFVRRAVRECTLARSDRYVGIAGRGGFGFWGLVRRLDAPRRSPVPPRLLRTGPDAPRWPGLPWAFGPLSGVRRDSPRASIPEGANARGLRRLVAARLQIASRRVRLPFGVSKGPATNRSGGVSAGSMSPSEVFAPSVKRPSTRVNALPYGVFFKDALGRRLAACTLAFGCGVWGGRLIVPGVFPRGGCPCVCFLRRP
jgi:hypothetical protein